MHAGELRAWRQAQRTALAAKRVGLAGDERTRASAAIHAHLAGLLANLPNVVGVYWPIRDEFDVRPFVAKLRARGITPALPVVVAKDRPLEFRAWNEGEPLVAGAFDIAHPGAGPALQPGALIVPLLGFDDAGFRLGYGAGHYDRTLVAMDPRPRTIGAGFACGRLATIHPQPYDIPMDAIVTEDGITQYAR